jgi:UDP-glucose:(heptosyl)LPS alpha-1,3-glucosyltransferase
VGRDEPGAWRKLAVELGVASRVRWLGVRDDMPRVYRAADALLLPTRYDAFANVSLEAAACALPVITSGANGAARWLGRAAVTVADPEDAVGFAKALDSLDDEDRRRQLGLAARARAEQSSWERHVEALHALYGRIRKPSGRRDS